MRKSNSSGKNSRPPARPARATEFKTSRAKNAESYMNKKSSGKGNFHIEFKNDVQALSWAAFRQHDVLFMCGPAGTGKSFLSCAFAIEQILSKERQKIILTRPVIEAGESLGFLPGTFEEKVNPYMMPMYDCIDKLVGKEGPWRERVEESMEIAPLAYMRGRTFDNAVCIFDEAQNATMSQLRLFLSRFGENSKVIITGDPAQSDIPGNKALPMVMDRLQSVPGIGIVQFQPQQIVRHPLVAKILENLQD